MIIKKQVGCLPATNCMTKALSPIIKWAGGKEKELKYIMSHIPQRFDDYYEPFVGGGSVFVSMKARHYYINDFSEELILLYNNIKSQDSEFLSFLEAIDAIWRNADVFFASNRDILFSIYHRYRVSAIDKEGLRNEISKFSKRSERRLTKILCPPFNSESKSFISEVNSSLRNKMCRMMDLERKKCILPDSDIFDNLETAVKNAVYIYFRKLYNCKELDCKLHCALFFFIRNYAYSGMFRYNSKGDFNVPFGGIAYNKKMLKPKIDYYKSAELSSLFTKTTVANCDFEEFFTKHSPNPNDFVFLDPPYDSEFSSYAQNDFSREDHIRLANCLLGKLKCKWLMIIKSTPFILSLYSGQEGVSITSFDKKYQVSFMNRNNKDVTHLIIKNY